MSIPIFPVLVGQGWPTRSQEQSNIVAKAQSGREVRISNYNQSLYKWDLPFGYLNDNLNIATADWQVIMGFFDLMNGSYEPFLFTDPADCDTTQFGNPSSPTPSQIGTGDGVTTTFQLARTFGGSSKLIYYVNAINRAPRIYLNGTLFGGSYSISATGLVTFGSPPGSGVTVAWDGQFYFLVRFTEDAIESKGIAGSFWEIQKISLSEVFQ